MMSQCKKLGIYKLKDKMMFNLITLIKLLNSLFVFKFTFNLKVTFL